MTASTVPVAIIGSGPYGLAIAAHMSTAGIETRIFGEPMGFWQQMPVGMRLRSAWDASHISAPRGSLTLDEYQAAQRVRLPRPVPLDDFVRYGLWFQRQVAPAVDQRKVVLVDPVTGGFRLVLADGEMVHARRIVVAAGIAPFAWRPPAFEELPPTLASHSSEHRDLGCFAGRRVVVVGAGQSALESAALLLEAGADVEVLTRAAQVHWLRRSTLRRYVGPLDAILYPRTDVGPPGLNWIVAAPHFFRRLPGGLQERLARRSIRPAGASWLRPRLAHVPITLNVEVVSASPAKRQLRLSLDDGSDRVVDHVLVATGYRIDLERYGFLSDNLFRGIRRAGGHPRLGAGFESSIPALHFVGAPAEWSFGPVMRFVSGTQFTARELVRYVLRDTGGGRQRT